MHTELDREISKNEAVKTCTVQVLEFLKQEEDETLDDTILKLEALKKILEQDSDKESAFDELIQKVKITKEARSLSNSIRFWLTF